MKFLLTTLVVLFGSVAGYSQEITYFDNIEEIIINNCAPCHKKGGYGPFPLTTYDEVKSKGSFIGYVTKTKYMPPWKADPQFQSYKNQVILSDNEIATIQAWVSGGFKKGKSKGPKPVIKDLLVDQKADLVIEMKAPFELSEEAIEDYRFFNIPTNLEEDVYLKSVEFIPGNKQVVHHSRIMADTSSLMHEIDGMSEYDPDIRKFMSIPLADEFLYGWVPGNLPVLYPEGTGKKMYAGTDLLLNIHYAPTSKTEYDQSKIKLYYTKEPVEHEIKTLAIRETHISNQPFYLHAETVPTFYVSYTVEEEMNLVSILPHMHYLGKSFKALAVTPDGDAIPLIKIDEWDFNWQSTYLFNDIIKIPAQSVILVTATYDNTSENPANPNAPAIDVGYGWNTTDEMMNLVIYYY
ncbi:MAG: hypothetical protein RLO12_15795 [Fulvivirga sp.]